MAKDQRNVEAITPMEEDFAKWYTDICLKAELVDYATREGLYDPAPLWLRHLGEHPAHHGRRCSKRPAMRTWPCPC